MPAITPAIAGWIKDKTPTKRRRQLAESRVKARQLTAGARPLPEALIIGAQRSGTSSLYKYLGAHPQVYASLRKEIEYFSTRFAEGESWYRGHFPLGIRRDARRRTTNRSTLAFEATPDYLLHPYAAQRAAELLPSARIIALLRNPVDRAISQYGHNRRLGQEPLDFVDALDQEEARLRDEPARLAEDPNYAARPLRRYSYVTRGRYAEQLRRWKAWFDDDQILILRFEDVAADWPGALKAIEAFLGLEEWYPPEFANHSYGRAGKEAPEPVAQSVRDRLAAEFRTPNEHLAEMLGYDLGWDEPAGGA